MKKEKDIMLVTMILNFVIASIKLVCGIVFNFSSLIADSLHSLSDFVTDIISMVASRIGKKRANKKYPFGYGMVENIANLMIGIILFLLGVFIFIEAFKTGEIVLRPAIFIILVVTISLKLVIVFILYVMGKKINNSSLLISAKESAIDLIATFIVLIVSILLLFKDRVPVLGYANCVGSVLISFIVFNMAIRIIMENIEYLIGINEDDKDVIDGIKDIVGREKLVRGNSIKLIKMGNYYNLYLLIELDADSSLRQLFNLEKRLKREIRKSKYKIKFIEIEPVEYKD